jgi:hypothetical protein
MNPVRVEFETILLPSARQPRFVYNTRRDSIGGSSVTSAVQYQILRRSSQKLDLQQSELPVAAFQALVSTSSLAAVDHGQPSHKAS